jgi:hypothetical protein
MDDGLLTQANPNPHLTPPPDLRSEQTMSKRYSLTDVHVLVVLGLEPGHVLGLAGAPRGLLGGRLLVVGGRRDGVVRHIERGGPARQGRMGFRV